MKIKFIIDGNPFGKQRPLVVNHHGVKRPETRIYERKARGSWQRTFTGKEFDGPIEMHVVAYYEIPKSWPKWKKKAAEERLIRPIRKSSLKPDVDNVAKMVMDSCNPATYRRKKVESGIYLDDGQVVDLKIESWYSAYPRVEVFINAKDDYSIDTIKELVKTDKKI